MNNLLNDHGDCCYFNTVNSTEDHYHSILRVFGCYYEPNRKTLERIMHGLVH